MPIFTLLATAAASAPAPAAPSASVQASNASSWISPEQWAGLVDKSTTWIINALPAAIGALVLLVLAYTIARTARTAVLRGLARAEVDLTLSKFLANLVKWVIIIFALIACAGTLGIQTTGFAAAIAAAGLAIGLALQGNLSNLASGVLLLIFRPFKIGDSVIVAGQAGIVDGIDLFTTNLDTGDNRRIIVPNAAIFGGIIENQTHHRTRRASVNVVVGAHISLDEAERLLLDAARTAAQTTGAVSDPPPAAGLAEITPAPHTTWTVALSAQTPAFGSVRTAMHRAVRETMDRHAKHPQAAPQRMHLISDKTSG
ncbi:MAG: mechanosensitive ion channel family protein [Planctomyces sp.]